MSPRDWDNLLAVVLCAIATGALLVGLAMLAGPLALIGGSVGVALLGMAVA